MSEDVSVLTEEMRRRYLASATGAQFRYTVTLQAADQFSTVVGACEGADSEEARRRAGWPPPTLVASLDPFERKVVPDDGVLAAIPYQPIGGGNAFTEVEYFAPLPIGEEVSIVFTPTELVEKPGSQGRLVFRNRQSDVFSADGTLIARIRAGHVMVYDTGRRSR
jgi:hypothetical protein